MSATTVPEDLRGVAAAAVQGYLSEDAPFALLGHSQSLTYRVDASSGRYLLRVHSPLSPPSDPEFSTPAALESECA